VLTKTTNLYNYTITNFLNYSFDKAMKQAFETEEIKGNPEHYQEASRHVGDTRINGYTNDIQNPEAGRY
jgi:hypothetical protein